MADKGNEKGTIWGNTRKCYGCKREYLPASSPDDHYVLVISARLIRECADIISGPLCDLFNKSLMSGIFLACERRRISGCHLVPPKNNVCEPEPRNDFCDIMTYVSPWPIRVNDRMKLECSSQRIPRVVLELFELNCDWLRIPTSQKSFSGSGSQMLFFGGTK